MAPENQLAEMPHGHTGTRDMKTGFTVPVVELHTSTSAIEDDWRRLEADNLNSLHQSMAWCNAWIATHNHEVAIVRGRENGRTVFILPLEIVREGAFRVARFIGGSYNNINTGLFDADYVQRSDAKRARLLEKSIRTALAGRADLVALRTIPLEWRGRTSPFSPLASVENQNHSFQLPLMATLTETLTQLNAKRRRERFRNQTRRINEAGGYSHIFARTPDEKHMLLERFFEQKAERFRSMGIPDVFDGKDTQAFFHRLSVTEENGSDRILELHALTLHGQNEGRIAAIASLSRKGDHVLCQFGSIDQTAAPEASPGDLLFWHLVDRACVEGAGLFDFGLGDQAYKRGWCPVETVHHDILIPVNATGRLGRIMALATVRAKTSVKSNPKLYAFLQKLRATLKNKAG